MSILIIKLGATGDVVRSTPLLRRLDSKVTWVTASKNQSLLQGLPEVRSDLRVLAWEDRSIIEGESFDLVINLEDELDTARFARSVRAKRTFGAYVDDSGRMSYTED